MDTTSPATHRNRCKPANQVVRDVDTKEHGMSTLIAVVFGGLALAAGIALHELQVRLERWDYERHAED